MSAAGHDDMSDEGLDQLIRTAGGLLASELRRVADVDEALRAVERAAATADLEPAGPAWGAVLTFPLPVPAERADLAAASPPQGSPPVARAASPDGLAVYLLYRRDNGEYWVEVSLDPEAATPVVVVVGGERGQPYLMIPVGDDDSSTPSSLARLPWSEPGDWYGTSLIAPADVPAWDADLITASVLAARTSATVNAWEQVAMLVSEQARRLILDALRTAGE